MHLLKIEENLNYIKIKFFVEQTYVNTKIINSDFLFTYQIDYITKTQNHTSITTVL